MDTAPSDFPFDILDVAQLLHLHIRRRQAESVYTDCPFCGDKRGKMNLNFVKNVWRCNYCGARGGMLALYARVHGTTNSAAYSEICDALQTGETGWGCGSIRTAAAGTSCGKFPAPGRLREETPHPSRADAQTVHQTLSLLFNMLTLKPEHLAHLKSEKRGLTDEQIRKLGFKSTPPYHLCRSLAARLIAQGYTVEGVPGFYQDKEGRWTVAFSSHASGILIPAVSIDGFLCGAQILLDKPFKDADDPPEKPGTKYIWFSSASKPMGTGSGSPVHFVGDPFSRVIYVTEGLLKADIAHCLTGRSFVAIAGANNVRGLDKVFARLTQNGTELIIEAHDMDKLSNPCFMQTRPPCRCYMNRTRQPRAAAICGCTAPAVIQIDQSCCMNTSRDRGTCHPKKFLDGFKGYLHTDGYKVYRNLSDEITVVGCWAHARRKFDEAMKSLPKGKAKNSSAAQGLAYCDLLFKIEGGLTDFSPEERYDRRLKQEKPVLDALLAWANAREPSHRNPFWARHCVISKMSGPICSII